MQQIAPFDIVIFHANCFDGFGSAWVARKHSPGATFIAAKHGDPLPDVVGNRVLICDFSYSREVLLGLWRTAAYVMLLDHHKTAEADIADSAEAIERGHHACGRRTLDITFDMERSGIGITWDTLFPRVPRPALWRFWLPETRAHHAALSMIPFDFDAWDAFAERPIAEVEIEGAAVLKYTANVCAKLAARARHVTLTGPGGLVEVWAVNAPPELLSDVAEALKDREPHMPIFAWSWDGESCNFYCSLRSRDDGPDVSEIAKRFGGGGHEHAAGFRCSFLEMMDPGHDVIEVHS